MKRCLVAISLLLLVLGVSTAVIAQTPAPANTGLPTTVTDVRYGECPVMGGKPQANVALMHAGKIYHFCCPSCFDEFRKDPAAAIAKLKSPTETALRVTNTAGKCPVTGEAAKADVFLVRQDTVTFYCCPSCIGKDVPAPVASPTSGAAAPAAPADAASSAVQPGATCGLDGVCK